MEYAVVLNTFNVKYRENANEVMGFLQKYHLEKNAVTLLICDSKKDVSDYLSICPTEYVDLLYLERYQPEEALALLEEYHSNNKKECYLFPCAYYSQELSPRLAHRLNGSSVIFAESIEHEKDEVVCTKKVYGGHVRAQLTLNDKPFCVVMDKGVKQSKERSFIPSIQKTYSLSSQLSSHVISSFTKKQETKGFENCESIIVLGRGVGKKENVQTLQELAEILHLKVGVSRPVAMNAWASMEQLIGVSGSVVSPRISIAAGISGSCALYAGIENSEMIISVNTDPNAPIHKMSDYVVVEDCTEFLKCLMFLMQDER